MNKTFSLKLNELPNWTSNWAKELESQTIVLLKGPLGAGKSLLVQSVVKALGGEQSQSPTYSLINQYQTDKINPVYHVDLYRLNDDEDLDSVGFWDLFESDKALIFIEWADRLNFEELPFTWSQYLIEISKTKTDDNRTYQLTKLN